jgi:hypothetical protein
MDNHPLDDRDTTPWQDAESELSDNTLTEDDGEDQEAYKQDREDERMDEHFAGSEGNVY